jgi:phage major head subunit gpT-like protein
MGSPFDLVSRDAQRALEEFSQDFALAFSQGTGVEQWAKELGLHKTSRALKTTFPIPFSAAGYKEFLGDIKYRGLLEKSITLKPKTWQDGIAELASIIEAPDFIGWDQEPAAIAAAADSLLNEIVAALIEANPTLEIDGKTLFAADHPFNVMKLSLGTFDNDVTGAGTRFTAANLKTAKQMFRAMKAPNGKPMGLRMTHALFPSIQEEEVKDLLENDMLIQAIEDADGDKQFGAIGNRHKGTIKAVFSDELDDDDKWYPLALNKPGMYPWVTQDDGSPEEIRSDKSSALYATTLKVGIAYIRSGNGGMALPQCIQRWAGTAP